MAGMGLKREVGERTVSFSLSGGVGDMDLICRVSTPDGSTPRPAKPRTSWAAAHARLAQVFPTGPTAYLRPWIDLGLQRVNQDSYRESGAGITACGSAGSARH